MKKKIEQILNGKFKYDQPELLFSKEKLEIKIKAGTTTQGELYLGTENNDKIQGYITSSDRRFVPGNSRFSGTTVRRLMELTQWECRLVIYAEAGSV